MNPKIFLKKIINTFLTLNLSFINYSRIYNKKNFLFTFLSRFIWFIPSNFQALYWKNSENIAHGHSHFIEMDDKALLLKKEICNYATKEDKILDVCCSVGRMLNSLNQEGFSNLHGFDINKTAIDQNRKIFNKFNNVKLVSNSAEEYLPTKANNEFDIVFSLSASLELIPPSFPLIKEISRITKKYFICIIAENEHAYPRFWVYEFKKNNFKIIKNYKVNQTLTLFVLKKMK